MSDNLDLWKAAMNSACGKFKTIKCAGVYSVGVECGKWPYDDADRTKSLHSVEVLKLINNFGPGGDKVDVRGYARHLELGCSAAKFMCQKCASFDEDSFFEIVFDKMKGQGEKYTVGMVVGRQLSLYCQFFGEKELKSRGINEAAVHAGTACAILNKISNDLGQPVPK